MRNYFENNTEIEKLLNEVSEVAGYLWERGWAEKNAGNISVCLPDRIADEVSLYSEELKSSQSIPDLKGLCFYVTGTGKCMRDIAKSALENGVFIQINEDGSAYYVIDPRQKNNKPTSELSTHFGIHRIIAHRRTGQKVVLHTHATELITLTQNKSIKTSRLLNTILWGMHPETMVFVPGGVGFVPYMLPGSENIAEATVESFKDHDIVLWEKHGVFAIGKTIYDAFDTIEIICKSAKIWFQCMAAGFEPEGLTDSQLAELKKLVEKFNL